MAKIIGTNRQTMFYETLHNKHRFSNSCSTSCSLVTETVIRHEWGKNRIVITTNETYPWSFLTPIFTFIMMYLLHLIHIQVLYTYSTSNSTIRDMYEWYHGSEPRTWSYPESKVSIHSNCVLLMANCSFTWPLCCNNGAWSGKTSR